MTYEELMRILFKKRIGFNQKETALLSYICEHPRPTTTRICSDLNLSRRYLLIIRNGINKKLEYANSGIVLESIPQDIKKPTPNVWRLVVS